MKKFYLVLLLFIAPFCEQVVAQTNPALAKAEYQLAEQAYSKSEYASALEHINMAVKHAGKDNQLTLYLRVMNAYGVTKVASAYLDSLNGSLATFYANPISKKLDAQRYQEVETIKAAAEKIGADKQAKTELFSPVRSFCNYAFPVGTDLEASNVVSSKKMRNVLKQKMQMKLNLMDFDLVKNTSFTYSDPTYLVTNKDISEIAGIACTGERKDLFPSLGLDLAGIVVNEKNKVMSHVYLANARDKSMDVLDAVIKDLGIPLSTETIGGEMGRVWKYGTLYVLYTFTGGDHAVMMWDAQTLH